MAISNALVDLLDGEIRAESPGLGLGSTFTITFPTVDPAANGSEPTSASRKLQDKVRLLLVEDHGDTARALARLLENRGFTTKIAPSIATALEAIGREDFDLFLCRRWVCPMATASTSRAGSGKLRADFRKRTECATLLARERYSDY